MRICFFGDSFTNGTGDDECLGWVGRICAAERRRGFDFTFYNLGVRRETSADIMARWEREAHARLPTNLDPHLVFAFGNNDASWCDDGRSRRLEAAATLANAKQILVAASALAPTLMIGPVPLSDGMREEYLVSLSADLAALCRDRAVPFLDLAQAPDDSWTLWRCEAARGDGAHPGAGGYTALASFIGAWSAWRAWFE